MKKLLLVSFIIICSFYRSYAQTNLVSNPSFEEFWGGCNPFALSGADIITNYDTLPLSNFCALKDWIEISNTPDVYSLNLYPNVLPTNFHSKYTYPHSDSSFVGGFQLFHGIGGGAKNREIMQNRLKDSLIVGHRYLFRIWVQLFDTILPNETDIGQIVGINSFSAFFSDTVVHWCSNFDITHFTPQVQINQMITDTGSWVLLQDTFVAKGGERYMCIGNFKTDSQLQWQLVDSIRNLPIASYYFYDDVSLIDLDSAANGVVQVGKSKTQLSIYPNPTSNELIISNSQLRIEKVEIENILGQIVLHPFISSSSNLLINVVNLPSGIYFLKATDEKGFIHSAKFIKE